MPAAVQSASLTSTTTSEQALQLLLGGRVTPDAYAAWTAEREARVVASSPKPAKRSLHFTRQAFRQQAKALTLTVDGKPLTADAREFSTGSLGWYVSGKVQVLVDGQPVLVQASVSLTVIGSKELPE